MSGFEIAGVVLGSIPLLISALEHYGEGISTIQRWRKYQRERQSLIRNLQTEQVKLQNVFEKLLVGLVPASDIEVMIENPRGPLWRQEAIERKIRARLWMSWTVFDDTIEDIRIAIDEMQREIDSQRDGNVSELRRGIFTLKRFHYEERLSTIRNGVSNLENLTDRNIELEPERRVRSQTKLFSVLRDMAGSFYRALLTSFRCSCQHQVGLALQRRSADITPMDDDDRIMKDLSFQLAISYESMTRSDEANPEAVLSWQEIVVKATWTPPPLAPSQTTKLAPAKSKAKKSVSFLSFQSTTSTYSSGTSTTTVTNVVQNSTELHTLIPNLTMGVASSVAFSSVGVALDLCGTLHQAQKQAATDTFGTLVDQHPQATRRYSVHPAPSADDSRSWSVVSLRDILDQKSRFPPLSYRDRLRLAVVISSSVLQLHGTPWLPSILTSRHIFFIQKNNSPNPAMYWQPVLLRHLPGGEDQPVIDQTAITAERNPTLLSLGCVLIEVILGRTLDSRSARAGVDLMSDYVAAQGLMDEVRMKSSNYERAVASCVDGKLHRHGCGLEDGDLCQDVYSGVVALLERDLENS
ncbi:hypothetical protein C8A01DRAFT_15233 [Parachaetomium inaequale]|uniref:DUF7580 domain-containing protein n=1 Tax=Parachaetomium inaequale TaxID=2588326 RepID=A0AAN6PH90_9PEZI|nr:hypothetical protein C8A01DRAFT_15233 [Parachaetomium inaequale]